MTQCSVEGCGRAAHARTWCTKHYQRWQRNGKPEEVRLPEWSRCRMAGCLNKAHARGMCPKHYQRWRGRNSRTVRVPDAEMPAEHAWCVGCATVHPWTAFPRRIRERNIKSSTCFLCLKKPAEPPARRAKARLMAVADGFRWCTRCEGPKPASEFTKTARQCKPCRLISNRITLYGIDERAIAELERVQAGRCAICGSWPAKTKTLALDHDHVTGRARSLLCDSCNKGIGFFRDSPLLLTEAAAYLTRWQESPEEDRAVSVRTGDTA